MRFITVPLQTSWRVLFFVNAGITFLILFPFFYVLLQKEKWFPHVLRLQKLWAFFMLHPMGVFHCVKKEQRLDRKQAYVFCPNHTSYLDVIMCGYLVPNYFHFMAKASLSRLPLFGLFFRRMSIPVDRTSVTSSHKAFLRASSDLDKGVSVLLFPEGTIPSHAPLMGKFKTGAFKLAIEKQVPVVPIVFIDNWKLLPDERSIGRPGISRMVFLAPVETKGMTANDVETLKNSVFEKITNTQKTYGHQ